MQLTSFTLGMLKSYGQTASRKKLAHSMGEQFHFGFILRI